MLPPGYQWVSSKMFSQFGSAVWPAIAKKYSIPVRTCVLIFSFMFNFDVTIILNHRFLQLLLITVSYNYCLSPFLTIIVNHCFLQLLYIPVSYNHCLSPFLTIIVNHRFLQLLFITVSYNYC